MVILFGVLITVLILECMCVFVRRLDRVSFQVRFVFSEESVRWRVYRLRWFGRVHKIHS